MKGLMGGGRPRLIGLAGNPNVGKSTVFNALTGLKQHTGNWPGKTVACLEGRANFEGREYILCDLPGCYSLDARSAEEEAARDFIRFGGAEAVIVVCDATCLGRNLILALQVMELAPRTVVCVNLMDEAEKKGIHVDLALLERELNIPVVGCCARSNKGLDELMRAVERVCAGPARTDDAVPDADTAAEPDDEKAAKTAKRAAGLADAAVSCTGGGDARDRRIDRILTSKWAGFPIMFLLLALILYITIVAANYPSEWLSGLLFGIEDRLMDFFTGSAVPEWLYEPLILGVYRVLAWVVSVMLPPMMIFFPLFTLLEDLGYLPRVAFNLDRCYKCCNACGKQALTMCMGLGCNAVGVTGCRIIDSKRERLIAMLTNTFMPCNGRFPLIIALITMFFVSGVGKAASALMLSAAIVLGVAVTLIASRALSMTLLKGMPSSYTLELPPYRTPQVGKVIVRSILDRTLYVLGRAVKVAAPAGLVIWIMANVDINGASALYWCSEALDPVGRFLGMDGVILMAFILALPANEIVLPIIIMAYTSAGTITDAASLASLSALLAENGWTALTAVCTIMFSIMHWPCSTTLITIRKESGSLKWAALGFLLPTLAGVVMCAAVANIARLF